jgi:hypothetical protein
VNALGWEGGTTKHPPDAPHWKPPPTEVYSADCVEGEFYEVHIQNPALSRSSRLSKGWLASVPYEGPPLHVVRLDRYARS